MFKLIKTVWTKKPPNKPNLLLSADWDTRAEGKGKWKGGQGEKKGRKGYKHATLPDRDLARLLAKAESDTAGPQMGMSPLHLVLAFCSIALSHSSLLLASL